MLTSIKAVKLHPHIVVANGLLLFQILQLIFMIRLSKKIHVFLDFNHIYRSFSKMCRSFSFHKLPAMRLENEFAILRS